MSKQRATEQDDSHAAQVAEANRPVPVTGIWLQRRIGPGVRAQLRVLAEVDGEWRVLIEELDDGPISHIVEPSGIRDADPED